MALKSKLNIYNSNFNNCYSEKNGGVIYFNNWEGKLYIKDSIFNNNKANKNGGIFDISGENVLENAEIIIDGSEFINNEANLGGY